MPLLVRGYRRQIIQQGPMKMKDAKNSQDVYCYLFTDMLLITKGGKRSGTSNPSAATSSSLTSGSNDGQFNRGAPLTINKILKPPIRVDRLEVREYDRRGGSSTEPNTVSEDQSHARWRRVVFVRFPLGFFRAYRLLGISIDRKWLPLSNQSE